MYQLEVSAIFDLWSFYFQARGRQRMFKKLCITNQPRVTNIIKLRLTQAHSGSLRLLLSDSESDPEPGLTLKSWRPPPYSRLGHAYSRLGHSPHNFSVFSCLLAGWATPTPGWATSKHCWATLKYGWATLKHGMYTSKHNWATHKLGWATPKHGWATPKLG